MEPTPNRSETDPTVPIHHRLPDGRNKVARLADQTRGLVDDLKTWVDLRLKLEQVKFWDEADARVNELTVGVITGVLLALGGLFVLLGFAFLIGWWLGNTFWGFFIVGALMILIGVVFKSANPHLLELRKPALVDEDKVERGRPATPRP